VVGFCVRGVESPSSATVVLVNCAVLHSSLLGLPCLLLYLYYRSDLSSGTNGTKPERDQTIFRTTDG
jgi:hypothetical protein